MNAMTFDPFGDIDRLRDAFRTGARAVPVDLVREGDRYLLNADLPELTRDRSTSTWTATC